MDFQKLQEGLASLTMDTSAYYAVGGAGNKICINAAYEYMRDILKSSEKAKRNMVKSKTLVNFTDKIGNLPADFDVEDIVSLFDFSVESDIEGISDSRYHDYRILGPRGTKTMHLQTPESKLYISYVPVISQLTNNSDTPDIPEELHPCIADFGLYEYYRRTRDMPAAADSLALAQEIMYNKLASLG